MRREEGGEEVGREGGGRGRRERGERGMREGKREYLVTAEVKVREEGGRLGGEGEGEGEGDRRDGRVGESERLWVWEDILNGE